MNDHEHDERVFNLGFRAAVVQVLTHLKREQARYPIDAGGHGRRMIEWVEQLAPDHKVHICDFPDCQQLLTFRGYCQEHKPTTSGEG